MSDEKVFLAIPASATLIGTTVTALVYSVISATGEISASATSSGIEMAGSVLGYGTELIAGSIAGNTIRGLSKTYSILSKPAISNASRIGALGISAAAGTGAVLATTVIVNGSKYIGSYLYSYYKDYKQKTESQDPNSTAEGYIILEEPSTS
jgi:hypothetical protein